MPPPPPARARNAPPSRRLRGSAGLLALALLVGACTSGDGDAADNGGTGADGEAADTTNPDGAADGAPARLEDGAIVGATFVEGTCGFELPAGSEPRCGTVTVPSDWDGGTGSLALAVAVFPSLAAEPAADPVIYLEGGPGGHALETFQFAASDLAVFAERGELVVFDQRGAGLSDPQLTCDETTEVARRSEDEPDMSVEEGETLYRDALAACSARFGDAGVDLGDFTSVNNAHDVEAIRVALGYETWNLYGVSYGTRLGLEVLRQHPDNVRSVILDSVFPPEVDSVSENPASFLASYEAVVAACAAEPSCAAQGDLGERLTAVIQGLEADPVQVEITDYLSGETDTVFADGYTVLGILTQSLYSPAWFTDLPELLSDIEAGKTEALAAFLSQLRTTESFFSDGMFYAIECNEEIPLADPDEVAAAVPPDPFGLQDTFEIASNAGTNAFPTCEAFGSGEGGEVPPGSADRVTSDVPTLLLAGRYDPVTPVAWAESAAEGLSNGQLLVAPNGSHGIAGTACSDGIMTAFLDDPTATADGACLADDSFAFISGEPEPVELVPFEVAAPDGSGTLVGVRPDGWEEGSGGDFYRQTSFLDQTQLIYIVGDASTAGVMAEVLGSQLGVTIGEPAEITDGSGQTWSRRSGQSGTTGAEVYQRPVDGGEALVILVGAAEEIDQLRSTVLEPSLEHVAVAG